jgi:protease I
VGVLAADGFELVELAIPVAALRGTGAKVEIISLRRGRIRGVNLHEPARRVRVTKTLAEAQPEDYDGLLIPGGFINPDLLRQSAAARHFVRHFDEMGRPLATLCHGPWLLASAGLTRGRTMTSWPGIRDDLVNAGATWVDEALVHDRNWISSRGPQDMPAFVRAMLQHFRGLDPNPGAVAGHVGSSPQRTEPPKVVLAAMKWTPRPSLRTVVALGLVGLWALSRSRAGGVTELRGS